jgi:hypothetical protein
VLGTFPGVCEFTIHKEFVSAKVAGETASLLNPALDRILDFAHTVGLVVLIHNDTLSIDVSVESQVERGMGDAPMIQRRTHCGSLSALYRASAHGNAARFCTWGSSVEA